MKILSLQPTIVKDLKIVDMCFVIYSVDCVRYFYYTSKYNS